MARAVDGYSRFVATLKIVLPIAAIGLLSTLFFFSGEVDPTQSLPFKELDVANIAREQRLSGARSTGVTQDGSNFAVFAERARPDLANTEITRFVGLDAQIIDPKSGLVTALNAPTGFSDSGAEFAVFSGGTHIFTSDNLRMRTATLNLYLDENVIESAGRVDAEGDFGQLTAGRMRISQDGPGGTQVTVFQDGVNLIYQPAKE